ncbi:NADPH dependent diflavin oxidoreductase-like protein 1 [Trematosphaeria pertusa]|uniref:NADPH-dependent diflavin oxidoreductase 1 n=1 Tax=Trematosphaeria pertusa TaxID=390896 RepID=A0A6A6ID55_9PLEO|nr:NADPH dependent diflavin oxidoreductase-like protein 1 [Trematosphaeria pertusa]KAF2248356.1 NADPH dependent diflavin oxidoreductase-like protein 1 [Trematosphaeria pertusa]
MTSTLQARRALVLYGSETGNAQDVAEELGKIAERLRFDTEVAELNAISLKQLVRNSVVLIAISTTGQGDLPANSQTFWKALRSARLRPGCLQQVKFASFGLGDTSYPKFNWAHRKLYNRLIQLGAQPICDRGESDEQHPEGIDGSFLPWSTNLRQRLLQEYPLPDSLEPIPDDVLLDPKWLLDFADEAQPPHQDINQNAFPSSTVNEEIPDVAPNDLLDIPGGLVAKVVSNQRITPTSHWQDVRHLTLKLAGTHPYNPGDVLTIYPKNFPSDVIQFLALMNWTSIADIPLHFVPSFPSTSPPSRLPITSMSPSSTITLRTLLTNHLDIMSIPRRSFFAHLAHFTTDPFQRDRLLEFTNPEYIDELYDYTTRPRRSILEVLQEFETVKIPWQRVCSVIPTIRGRQFSIASAMRPEEDGTKVELLIAIVKYKTVIKRIRQGVCTRYVALLKPGQDITVTLAKGGLGVTKAETAKPVVMVGPGTGVAPMRALIYQRKYWREEDQSTSTNEACAKDILFFGCRNAHSDYFFKDEWEQLKKEGVPLDVLAAFSRDQRQKVYVQDLVRQQSVSVYDALAKRGGIVYICGSSGKMPQAVREALIEAFQTHGSLSREDAEAYLVDMEKTGRYKQETW